MTIDVSIRDLDRKAYCIRDRLEDWHIEEFMSIFDRLKPMSVARIDGRLYLTDGFHRCAAAARLGRDTIQAIITDTNDKGAWEMVRADNADSALLWKTKERKKYARGLLLRFTERSDRWIAEDCGLSHETVAVIRSSMESTGEIRQFNSRESKDGKVRPAEMPKPAEPAPQLPPGNGDHSEPHKSEPPAQAPPTPPTTPTTSGDKPDSKSETAAIPQSEVLRFEMGPITIIQGSATFLPGYDLPPAHLIVTSPPYNVGIEYDTHDDNLPIDEYFKLLHDVFGKCYDALVSGGRIAVVVPVGMNRNPWIPFADKVLNMLSAVGFVPRGRISWDKGTSGGRTSWGSFRNPSNPSLRDTTEAILVCHKETPDLDIPAHILRHDSEGTYSPFLENQNYFLKLAQDHWLVPPELAQRIGHPAPFPVTLVERLIHFYAYPGAHILDPFAGSGTVGVAALRNGCDATLIDIAADYCELAKRRCEVELQLYQNQTH